MMSATQSSNYLSAPSHVSPLNGTCLENLDMIMTFRKYKDSEELLAKEKEALYADNFINVTLAS